MHYRLCADTNVLFSGLFFSGPPRQVVEQFVRREATLFLSQYIVDETLDVVGRKNALPEPFRKLLALSSVRVLADELYTSNALFFEAKRNVRDRKDIPIYAFAAYCLRTGVIDYFITGDKDLLTPAVLKALGNRVKTAAGYLELAALNGTT